MAAPHGDKELDCLFCLKAKNVNVASQAARSRRPSLWKRLPWRSNTESAQSEAASICNQPVIISHKKLKSTGVEIGRGAYGRVFEVEYEKTRYAAKEVHSLLLEAAQGKALENIKASFLHECHIWSLLQHPRIVEMIGIYYPANDRFKVPVIVMEKMQSSLTDLVEKHNDLTMKNITTILNDVCLGLQYLHTRTPPIVHRDLTPNNILLCYHLRAKITDLGVARTLQVTETKKLTKAPGTPDFMPLECLADKPVYGLPLDIFSFGGVILYITTRQWPTPAPWISIDENGKKLALNSELQRRQQYLDKMNRTFMCMCLKPLVISCLDDNPKNRPTVVKVLTEIEEINAFSEAPDYCEIPIFNKQVQVTTESQKQQKHLPHDQQQRQEQQHQPQLQQEQQQQIAQQEQHVQPEDQKQKQQLPQENQEQIKQPEKQKLERQQVQQLSPQLQQEQQQQIAQQVQPEDPEQKQQLPQENQEQIKQPEKQKLERQQVQQLSPQLQQEQQQQQQQIAQQVQPEDPEQKQQLPQENQEQIKQPEKQKLERQQVQQLSPQLQQEQQQQQIAQQVQPEDPEQKQQLPQENQEQIKQPEKQKLERQQVQQLSPQLQQEQQQQIAQQVQPEDQEQKQQLPQENQEQIKLPEKQKLERQQVQQLSSQLQQEQQQQQVAQQVQPEDQEQKQQLPQENQEQSKQPEKQKLERQRVQQVSQQSLQPFDRKQLKETSEKNQCTESEDMSVNRKLSDATVPLTVSCFQSNGDVKLPTHSLVIAKYDFFSRNYDRLNFKKGDLLYIINTEGEWWYARAKKSGQGGYIPHHSVTVADFNSLDDKDWFFGAITRKHAENLLMQPINDCGSFLIRNSESSPGGYSLSIKFKNTVRHYKIKHSSRGYHISKLTFGSISELVTHYSKAADGLCDNLKNACQITKPRSASSSEEATETWEIDRSSIQFVKKLGGSQFTEVWQGIWNGTTEVAVKELKPGIISANEFSQDAALIKQLRHPKLINIYAVCTQEEPIYIITELMKHGSLLEYLRGEGRLLKLPQLIDMGAQVAAGMAYLEENNYVHRDLAARNILVSENLICKVKVVSMARNLSDSIYKAHTKAKFLIRWTAPEAAMKRCFTVKSDVWSFGILLYELISYGLHFPYPGMNTAEVLEKLQTGYRMPCPKGCPEGLYKIMRECWRDDADSRPTFGSLRWTMEDYFIDNEPTHFYLHEIR